MMGRGIGPNTAKVNLGHIPTHCTPTCKETKSKLILGFEFTKSLDVGFNLFCYNQTDFFIFLFKKRGEKRRKKQKPVWPLAFKWNKKQNEKKLEQAYLRWLGQLNAATICVYWCWRGTDGDGNLRWGCDGGNCSWHCAVTVRMILPLDG